MKQERILVKGMPYPVHHVAILNVHEIIIQNATSYSAQFLGGAKHFNTSDNACDEKVISLVYHNFPDTTMNVEEFMVTYDQFAVWMKHLEFIDWCNGVVK